MRTVTSILMIISSLFLLSCFSSVWYYDGEIGQWANANKLFERDPYWKGSDDAYSIKIEDNKVLWLFGDTLISNKNSSIKRVPDDIKIIRNSIGIQTGLNPAEARMFFYWRKNNSINVPKPFFDSPYIPKGNWLWPGDGAVLPDGKTLIIFFMDITPKDTGLKFDSAGYQVAVISNFRDTPNKWEIQWVKNIVGYEPYKVLLGSGVLVEDDFLYAYGVCSANTDQEVCVVRWPVSIFEKNEPDLSNPEWWCGTDYGWVNSQKLGQIKPAILWNKGQAEFTVNKINGFNSEESFYLMTEAYPSNGSIGNSDLICRVSKSLVGPWSEKINIYKTLCRSNPKPKGLMVYAGKYHPELTGADMIFTYATNVSDINDLYSYKNIYYPRFLKADNKLIELLSKHL